MEHPTNVKRNGMSVLKFHLTKVFPPKDKVGLKLLKLMWAFNDFQTIFECYKMYRTKEEKMKKMKEEKMLDGLRKDIIFEKRRYCFRITCAHLSELLELLRAIQEDKNIEALVNEMPQSVKDDYQKIVNIPKEFRDLLVKIRNNGTFHYNNSKNDKEIIKTLEDWKKRQTEKTTIIAGETYRETRFLVADEVIGYQFGLFVKDSKKIPDEIIKQIADAQGNSKPFICALFNEYIKDRKLQHEITIV